MNPKNVDNIGKGFLGAVVVALVGIVKKYGHKFFRENASK